MKISRQWLQKFFDTELPDAQLLADALTFHAFEIESVENEVLDVKVTPNRGHDCLSHRGIAKELSAILDVPMKQDPLRVPVSLEPKTDTVEVAISEPALCSRYIAGYIQGVKVGPSPAWLRECLEAVGQRSINNVVDATNYVMFHLGQPLHAFDAGKLSQKDGAFSIAVRKAKKGERIIALDGKEYDCDASMLLITDAHSGMPIGIAGVKGGAPAAINEETTDIIIESANFDGVSVRKTAAALRLRTDASSRFEQVLSPELSAYGMNAAAELILELAGGKLAGFADEYPTKQDTMHASVTTSQVNSLLGPTFRDEDVAECFRRLDLPHTQTAEHFEVRVPFERLDLSLPEDLVEEVARIKGYDLIPSEELPPLSDVPAVNANFYAAEKKREELLTEGYSEVFTSIFAEKGDRVVANKVDGVRPYLRHTLTDGLKDAYERNVRNKDLLGLPDVKLFEIGTVWSKGKEDVYVGRVDKNGVHEELLSPNSLKVSAYEAVKVSDTVRFKSFSKYPFIVRDIALWVPEGTSAEEVLGIIRSHAGELLVRSEKFDEFKKADKVSYAFRLVFQSYDKTLTDSEANTRMESIYTAVKEKGWEVR
jgi:phenylalanyl-tRNA synthetase beta chain